MVEHEPDEYTLKAIAALSVAIREGIVPEHLEPKVVGLVESFVKETRPEVSIPVADEEGSNH